MLECEGVECQFTVILFLAGPRVCDKEQFTQRLIVKVCNFVIRRLGGSEFETKVIEDGLQYLFTERLLVCPESDRFGGYVRFL